MTSANYEGIIFDKKLNIFGLTFSPDFDTSQSMHISKILTSIEKKTAKSFKSYYEFEGFQIPILMIGNKATKEMFDYIINDDKYEKNFLNRNLKRLKEDSLDITFFKDSSRFNPFNQISICEENYYVYNKNLFLCRVYSDDVILFIGNPFIALFKEDELKANPRSKNELVKTLKGYKKYTDKYLSEIESRQKRYLKEIDMILEIMNSKIDFLIVGESKMFLTCGYSIIAGNNQDLEVFEKGIFPFKSEEGKLRRLSEEEVLNILYEKKDYEKRRNKIRIRIEYLEKLLKTKGFSWTIISKDKIKFNEDGTYSTWMNAQTDDDANFGWYSESDFIDWLNMEGKIPFSRGKVRYFAKILENISEGNFEFKSIEPKNYSKNTYYPVDTTEYVGVFISEGKTLKLSLGEIRKNIEKIKPIKRYTKKDFEKGLRTFSIKYKLRELLKD